MMPSFNPPSELDSSTSRYGSLVDDVLDDVADFDDFLRQFYPDGEGQVDTVLDNAVPNSNSISSSRSTLHLPNGPTLDSSPQLAPVPVVALVSSSLPGTLRHNTTPLPEQAAQEPGDSVNLSGKKPIRSGVKRKASKIYPCSLCSHETSNLRNLGNHMRDIHDVLAFKCDNCETRVARYDNLESHRKHCEPLPRPATAPKGLPVAVVDPLDKRKPAKRQRVSIRTLHPVTKPSLPQPSLPSFFEAQATVSREPTEAVLAAALNFSDETSALPPQAQGSGAEGASTDNDCSFTSSASSTETAVDLVLQNEALRLELAGARRTLGQLEGALKELEAVKIERDVWKTSYMREKQGLAYVNWNP
ncbi:hypothetical protein TWF730_010027 [Orbilia blumenaviensis]|uniref:C2H2-type domain-containing protein n=1 Tax=Orbilia blumenaviensis TaxID=1796055 RepID=A0AAV9UUX6_9PEZI